VVNTKIRLSADTALPSRRVFPFGLDGGKDEGRQTGTGPTQGCPRKTHYFSRLELIAGSYS
jgi:hypothetical protein